MLDKLLGFRVYLYVGAACFLAGSAAGWHFESVRFASFQGGVDAVGRAQETWAKSVAGRNKADKERSANAYETRIDELTTERDAALTKLQLNARRGVLPTPSASARDAVQRVCFDRRKLDDGLNRSVNQLLGELASVAARGDVAIAALQESSIWANQTGACLK